MDSAGAQARSLGEPIPASRARPPWGTVPERCLLACMVLFGAFQMFVSLHKLAGVEVAAMDLGYLEQVLWKISHGNWWAFSSVFQTPGIAGDGSVALYPLAYGFRYLGGSTFLFALQAIGTGIATWGVYRAGLLSGLKASMAVVLALVFMLAPGILAGSQFDFHPDFIALPFIVWAYVAYRRGRMGPYYLLALAAVLSKNMALFGYLGWGVGLIVWQRRYRDGLMALAGTLALMGLEFGWLIPHVWHAATQAANARVYGYLGHGFIGIITGLPTHLEPLAAHIFHSPGYWVAMFGATAGVCLLGAASVPAALALFLLNAASTLHQQHDLTSQYQVLLTAWLGLATVEAVARWPRWRGRLAFAAVVSTAAVQASVLSAGIIPLLASPQPGSAAAIRQAVSTIPLNTVAWAPDHVGAYLYRFPVFGQDHQAVPGLFLDGLPTLWREARTLRTALVGLEPVSPYFAQVVGEAIRAGYRINYHRGRVFVVSGHRAFAPGQPQSYTQVNEPQADTWVFPSWTLATKVGVVRWHAGVVAAPSGRRGYLVEPFRVWLNAGRYLVSAQLAESPAPAIEVGVLEWKGAASHRFPIRTGSTALVESVAVPKSGWVYVGVWASGRGAFAVGNLTIHRVVRG